MVPKEKIDFSSDLEAEIQTLLLEILLKFCESNLVSTIGEFTVGLNDFKLETRKICVDIYDNKVNYELHTNWEAEKNKIANLYMENENSARRRNMYYIDPGLKGIRKSIEYIKSLIGDKRKNLPEYLKSIKLRQFYIDIGVIWEPGDIYDLIDFEHNTISVNSEFSSITFGLSHDKNNDITTQKTNLLMWANGIQEIFHEVTPDKFALVHL